MKKLFVIALVVAVTVVLAASAFAVGPGKTVEWDGKGAGKVVFSGDSHKKAGACTVCHPKVFAMKKGAAITKADHVAGKFCGSCHDGKAAFDQSDANCAKCHKK